MARPGSAVFELVLDHDLKMRPRVPERFLGEIRVEQSVEVRVDAYPDRAFAGRVSRLHPTVDPASRTFEIEVLVPNPERLLRAGGFAKAEILTRRDARALAIPIEALVTYAGVNKVFAVRDGRAVAVEVSPGVRGRGWLEVTGALEAGTPVVTSGQTRLADGTPVEVRKPEPRGGEATDG
jgi:RND family efflux transporter MFP subunit